MAFPEHYPYIIIGTGIHGLSTAWYLAKALKSAKAGSGKNILVIDKAAIGAGASGIACGVIRNNYFQPGMLDLPTRIQVRGQDGTLHPVSHSPFPWS